MTKIWHSPAIQRAMSRQFDYNCEYCKKAFDEIQSLVRCEVVLTMPQCQRGIGRDQGDRATIDVTYTLAGDQGATFVAKTWARLS